jgi:signal transduction histidine kinase
VTAIREDANGKRERDRRVEGWAYQQQQPNGATFLHLIARLDYHAIVPKEPQQLGTASKQSIVKGFYRGGLLKHRDRAAIADSMLEPWPPKGWQDVNIQLARKSLNPDTRQATLAAYSHQGTTNLSVSMLSAPFVNAYATLRIKQQLDSSEPRRWTPLPPEALRGKVDGADSWIRLVDGDLLIQQAPSLVREQIVPDTNLVFEVTHPGTVIEKGVWQTAALLSLVLLGFLFLARHFWIRLLKPIWVLSAKATALVKSSVESEQELPYGDSRDEVAKLSTAFNDLLKETRRRAALQQAERERRSEDIRQKHLEDVKTREVSLKTIGHEIRSPLQALLGLHPDGDPSRRYIDRMIRAVDHLFGKAGPISFDSVPINLQQIDIAKFLSDQATNAASAKSPITNVEYTGPLRGVVCQVDPDAFEDTRKCRALSY